MQNSGVMFIDTVRVLSSYNYLKLGFLNIDQISCPDLNVSSVVALACMWICNYVRQRQREHTDDAPLF
jgi:hypothetical protein